MDNVGNGIRESSIRASVPILWYNGNLDQRGGYNTQTVSPDGMVYDNFVVPTGTLFNISSVFSNLAMDNPSAATTAHWEIRSGVSAGNGGSLVASGDGADAPANTGSKFQGAQTIYDNQVNGLSVTLGAGTYWLAVAPDTSGSNFATFTVTTSGAGAIGTPPGNDGHSFISSAANGFNFTPASDPDLNGPGTWDYSMGIIGTATVLPEPSSVILGLIGMITARKCVRPRRRSVRARSQVTTQRRR
jgi:hypothetical protein